MDPWDVEPQQNPGGAPKVVDPWDEPISGHDVQKLPGRLESFGRGAVQGATMGWADEIGGVLKSALNPDRLSNSYQIERDKIRANNKAAQQANPGTYFAGELGGGIASSFVPGLGIAKTAGIAKTIGQGALLGGVAGLGASESNDIKGMAIDTAGGAVVGGALGGVFGGAKKYLSRGSRAAAKELAPVAGEITEGAGKSASEAAKNAIEVLDMSVAGKLKKGMSAATKEAVKDAEQVGGGIVSGAPARLKDDIVKTIVRSANGKPRNDLVGKGGKMAKEVADFVYNDADLRRTYRDGEAFYQAILGRKEQTGQALSAVVKAVDETGDKVNGKAVANVMDMVVNKLKAEKKFDLAKMVRAKADTIASDFVTETERGKIFRKMSTQELWQHVQAAQSDAFGAGYNVIDPSAAKAAKAELSMALRGLLNEHIEGAAAKAKLPVDEVRSLNARYSMLDKLEKVAENTSRRNVAATEVGPFSMYNARQLMSGSLTGKALDMAGSAVAGVADAGTRAANTGLAALGEMARKGSKPAQIAAKAIDMGIPSATAMMLGRILTESAVTED